MILDDTSATKDVLFSNKEAMYMMSDYLDSIMAVNGIKFPSIQPFDITKKHFAYVENRLLKFVQTSGNGVDDNSDEIANNSVGMI